MRRLIYAPEMHTPEGMTATKVFNQAEHVASATAAVSPFLDRFFSVKKEALGKFPPGKPYRFYLEGNTTPPFQLAPGQTETPLDDRLLRTPEIDLTFHGFIKRVGGIVATTEGDAYLTTIDCYRRLGYAYSELEALLKNPDARPEDADRLSSELNTLCDQIPVLNSERNEFTAQRINATLQEGETGFLFFGAGHDIPSLLAEDIEVEPLDPRLNEIHREIDAGLNKETEVHFSGETKG